MSKSSSSSGSRTNSGDEGEQTENVTEKRPDLEKPTRSYEERLTEIEVPRTGQLKRTISTVSHQSPAKKRDRTKFWARSSNLRKRTDPRRRTKPKVTRKKSLHRSRSKTRSLLHCRERDRSRSTECSHQPPKNLDLFPQISVFNLMLIGDLTSVIDFVFKQRYWLLIHLTDINAAIIQVPINFWTDRCVIETLEDAVYILQVNKDTPDGNKVIDRFTYSTKECVTIIDPVLKKKRILWQDILSVEEMYAELLIFLDSQTFYDEDGSENYFPGKNNCFWPRTAQPYLLPSPSKEFNRKKKFIRTPSKSPSISPLSDSIIVLEKRRDSSQNVSSVGSSSDSTLSATSNGPPPFRSPFESPPSPSDEPYDPSNKERWTRSVTDQIKFLQETVASLENLIKQDKSKEQLNVAKPISTVKLEVDLMEISPQISEPEVPPESVNGSTSSFILEEICIQSAILQSYLSDNKQLEEQEESLRENAPTSSAVVSTIRSSSPLSRPGTLFHILQNSPNFQDQIIEVPTSEGSQQQDHQIETLKEQTIDNHSNNTVQVLPAQSSTPAPVQLAGALLPILPYVDSSESTDAGEGDVHTFGRSSQPCTTEKHYLIICFIMPWGTSHYVRELHSEHTMQEMLFFLQGYLYKYSCIDWNRDIVTLKMVNPARNLTKLPLTTKLGNARLGPHPIIFIYHQQFADRLKIKIYF